VLQQAVGEAAGRRAQVQATQAGHVEGKPGQRALQLVAAAADVAVVAAHFHLQPGGTKLARLVPPLTIHPYLSGQDETLGLLARFGETARDHFDVQAICFQGRFQHAGWAGHVESSGYHCMPPAAGNRIRRNQNTAVRRTCTFSLHA
jgi:hypothetical protein